MAVYTMPVLTEKNLKPENIVPVHQLEVCNDLLGDRPRLETFFEAEGYLFFRNVMDWGALAEAKRRMLAILIEAAIVPEGATEPIWTGKKPLLHQESPEFVGIAQAFFAHPRVTAFFEAAIGEPPKPMAVIEYRFNPPDVPLVPPHQDGFYAPGGGFLNVWVPLTEIDETLGGLALVPRLTQQDYLQAQQEPPYHLPANVVPADAWYRATYRPGDLLMFHPKTLHSPLPNRSKDRLRLSFDVRIALKSGPVPFVGTVDAVTPSSVTVRLDDGGTLTVRVDEDCFIRFDDPAVRQQLSSLTRSLAPGMRIMGTHLDGKAAQLRKPAGA